MKSSELRQRFLEYFRRNGHQVVASSSLVPVNDPTLLFTNAGMVQFKDTFLGREHRDYVRAASSQRCVRAGGKHNDLENVGYTARHHTFFEMLGNFSFGDYFKREAIGFAWEFLTKELKLDPGHLWITVYREDDEAADIWLKEIGIDANRLSRLDESSNFWSMGDTGPCGPCSEIFFDHGPDVPGGPPGTPEEDGDRYVEIWNLVFMQFDRDASGTLTPLPKPSVDTGMGLERIAAVMQGAHSNYGIDLFRNLIHAAAEIIGASERQSHSLNVVADHIRAAAFLITDGVMPANEGRGYVLRRIIRRAIRHGHRLGATGTFFHLLVDPLVREMGDAYPELTRARERVIDAIRSEEERFAETLEQGLRILDQDLAGLKSDTIPGTVAFKLYDTYGFPIDLTRDVAMERNLKIDMAGFEREMEKQRERARAASRFEVDYHSTIRLDHGSEFSGYDRDDDTAHVTEIYRDLAEQVDVLREGELGAVVLDRTAFYGESGGQVGDIGAIESPFGRFVVEDTRKHPSGAFLHIGRVERGEIGAGVAVSAHVDAERRQRIRRNHSATHLMHAALREVLGGHVTQKGSLVHADYLRFDFSHPGPVSPAELRRIEELVNAWIRANEEVETRIMGLDEAVASGAMALFGEKYDQKVRVLRMGDFSVELCGGTHVRRTGDIGLFRICSESGVAAGIRRIEAVTGEGALAWVTSSIEEPLTNIARALKTDRAQAYDKVLQLLDRLKQQEKELAQLKGQMASAAGDELMDRVRDVKGIKVLAAQLDGLDAKGLRDALDRLKDRLGSGAVVLAAVEGDKVNLIAGVTRDLTGRLHAGRLVGAVAARVGGKGGGRPDMAQAGGKDAAALPEALEAVPGFIEQQLA